MTLEKAIKHYEEKAECYEQQIRDEVWEPDSLSEHNCIKSAEEHRQLAKWLRELKQLKERESCETIKEIPKDYKYDTETNDFLVYRHMYIGHEIHVEKPVPRYRLEPQSCKYAINREAVLDCIDKYSKMIIRPHEFKEYILELPPVTPQPEVIRCKDCKHWTNNIGDSELRDNYCNEEAHGFYYRCSGDDYCSFAERRTDERFN